MIFKKQRELLDKVWKLIGTPKNAVTMLSIILVIGVGIFSAKILATGGRPAGKDEIPNAYSVYCDGQNIGTIVDKESINTILENTRQQYESKYGMKVVLTNHVKYEETYVEEQSLSNIGDIDKAIKSHAKPQVKSVVIQINGKDMVFLKDKETAEALLDSLKEPYIDKAEEMDRELIEIGFQEDVKIIEVYTEYGKLDEPEMALEKLTQGNIEKQIYIVEKGDNVWTIAKEHNLTVRDILEANAPMEESDIIQIGQELNLNVPDLPINILTVEKAEYKQPIPYETETKKTDTLYTNQTKVTQAGKEGETQIVAKLYRRNGIEDHREILSETVVKKPTKKIMLQGTKKIPAIIASRGGSGSMLWPTQGRISSRFGMRWGRMHNGLDIAAARGTPIYTVEAGIVSFSGYAGAFGNLVKVNHGDGIETYYAHMSSRVASVGQKVKKGQLIGYVGSTGNSTGSHLHFEVRINEIPHNPLNYLK